MADRAQADGICAICRSRIRRGHPVRGTGNHASGALAHATCVAAAISPGTDGCQCGHLRSAHPVTEGGRCLECPCVWFHEISPEEGEVRSDSPMTEGSLSTSVEAKVERPRQLVPQHAAHIIRALITGVNPRTGELLPEDGPLNEPDVLRALFLAVEALEGRALRAIKPGPPNRGARWTREDDEKLLELFDSGMKISSLAQRFGRTRGAITSRLVKLDRLEPDTFAPPDPSAEPSSAPR